MDDNNNRFIKLTEPVTEGQTWKGNSYIDARSDASTVPYLYNWDYTYQNVNMPYTVVTGTLDSTVTVLQQDNTFPAGDFDPNYYQQRNYSVEVYAKGVGLIYKDFLHWTWQTDPPPAHYEDGSYGIRLSLIDHNELLFYCKSFLFKQKLIRKVLIYSFINKAANMVSAFASYPANSICNTSKLAYSLYVLYYIFIFLLKYRTGDIQQIAFFFYCFYGIIGNLFLQCVYNVTVCFW